MLFPVEVYKIDLFGSFLLYNIIEDLLIHLSEFTRLCLVKLLLLVFGKVKISLLLLVPIFVDCIEVFIFCFVWGSAAIVKYMIEIFKIFCNILLLFRVELVNVSIEYDWFLFLLL